MLFPLFLKLTGRRVLVVGAGQVAATKLGALLAAGACVRVVAPQVAEGIERPGVAVERRPFEPRDLDDVWLVVAAATPEVNRDVAAAAAARRIFVNAVDDPDNASAYLGGVVRRAGVTFAISTDGRAPALAGLLREGLEALLPEAELEQWLATAERERRTWRAQGIALEQRRPLLLDALARRYGLAPAADAEEQRHTAKTKGAHSAPRRERRGAMGSPQADAGGPGRSPV